MKKYTVQIYQSGNYSEWNSFVDQAKNATFLFHRDFMEYHKNRFEDFSMMVFEEQKLVAIMPANRVDNTVYSHQGLTYGGLVYSSKIKGEAIESIVDAVLIFLKTYEIKEFYYKPIPSFYVTNGNATVEFFLLKRGAFLEKKEMNLAVNLSAPLHISKSKLKHFRRNQKFDLEIVENDSLETFWGTVLQPRLLEKHHTKPVHSIDEILGLKNNFPNQIQQYSIYFEDKMIAGITLFETENGVKSQYGATTAMGEKLRALDFLFITLIEKYKAQGKLFFDMGIVNENNVEGYNKGLLQQKEELGCSVYHQDFYKFELL